MLLLASYLKSFIVSTHHSIISCIINKRKNQMFFFL